MRRAFSFEHELPNPSYGAESSSTQIKGAECLGYAPTIGSQTRY